MKPPPGRYRLTTLSPPTNSIVTVDATGMDTTFARFTYDPLADLFAALPNMSVECTGTGTFIATWGGQNLTGTCVFLGP